MGEIDLRSVPLVGQLIDELPVGVVVIDADERVVLYNRYEARMARRAKERVLGEPFFDDAVAPCMDVRELAGVLRSELGRRPLRTDVEFSFGFPFNETPRDVLVRMRDHEFEGRPHAVLYVEDISARKAVERTREALSALLVHDLKNPLAALMANLGFLEEDLGEGTDPEIAESLHDARRASARMQSMLLDLLDVTRLQTRSMPLDRSETDLAELARVVVSDVAAVARAEDVAVRLRLTGDCVCSVDAGLIRRALGNLLDNALRYAPRGSEVCVEVRGENDALLLLVADEGPGVPPDARSAIFDPHARVEGGDAASMNRGLGLSLVHLVATAHGGRARVVPDVERGATFEVEIPRR